MPNPLRNHIAKLAAEAKAASARMPSGWGSVGTAVETPRPLAGTAHDPEPHAKVWDELSGGGVALPGMTFREAVGHHYANRPGGLAGVLARSQRAMDTSGIPFPVDDDWYQYGKWSMRDVDTPFPVLADPTLPRMGAAGQYREAGISISPAVAAADGPLSMRNATLEHEATHGLLFAPLLKGKGWSAPYHNLPFDSPSFADSDLNPIGGPSNEYLMRRSELDPRVAEIRRRFASVEGRDVNSPADAQDAWDWWRENKDRFASGGDQPKTSLYPSAFAMYDSLPKEAKDIIFRRMTQVPALAAPIATGGLLGGLTSRSEEQR